MRELLGLVLLSFAVTSIFMVPFIDLLFFLKRKYERFIDKRKENSETPIHDELMKEDETTPQGGGILLILVLASLTIVNSFFTSLNDPVTFIILLFTLISFGSLGLVDDIKWLTTKRKGKFLGLGRKQMFAVQIIFALFASWMIYSLMGINNIYVPVIGNLIIGFWYIPLAAFAIVAFSNAYNISDGLDGLSTGLLTISLFAFLALASATLNLTLASFVGIWIGSLFAFLYFNVYPARIYLGDAGALAFGATLAVVGLLSGKIIALGIIGGVYIIIVASSLLQILSKKILHKKLFPLAPIHMYFRYIGWEEPKVVTRFWLVQAMFAIFGLWLALLSK